MHHLEGIDRIAHASRDRALGRYVNERAKGSDFEATIGRSGIGLRLGPLSIGGACDTPGNPPPSGRGRVVTWAPTWGSKCKIRPPKCDCQVVGGNTLGGNQLGVATLQARFGGVTIDSGESTAYVPYYMLITAAAVGETPDNLVTGPNLPVLLTDSKSGRQPNMRRGSETEPSVGVLTFAFDGRHELVCVDWNLFSSITNQNQTTTYFNINNTAVHVFQDMWGIPIA